MIGLNKIVPHVAARLSHVWVVGHDEEGLFGIHQLFALFYHCPYAVAFFVQVFQPLFLYVVGRLLLIGIIHVAFQVNHILQSSKSRLLQQLPHAVLIAGLTVNVVFLQKIADMLFQRVDTFLHTQHAYFFIHVQHLFKEVQVVAFNFNGVTCFHKHAIVHQAF